MTDKKLTILLVDDDRFLLDMYVMKFQKSGMEIDSASNGTEALTKLRAGSSYDIILLDIIMPGIDGLELLKTIKEEKLLPNAVCIMLTNQAEDSEKAKAMGVDGYIVKATSIPSEVVEQVLNIYKSKQK